MQPAISAPPSVFSKQFVSTDQNITSAGALTLAHGLGVAPKLVSLELVCATAEGGYSIGAVVPHPFGLLEATASRGVAVHVDATNLNCRFGTTAAAFSIPRADTGAAIAITNANWRARFSAWAGP